MHRHAMTLRPNRTKLAEGLVQLYDLAMSEDRTHVAEHLLCALEALADHQPAAQRSLEQTYLSLNRPMCRSSGSSLQWKRTRGP
jgi:hypothetical protein